MRVFLPNLLAEFDSNQSQVMILTNTEGVVTRAASDCVTTGVQPARRWRAVERFPNAFDCYLRTLNVSQVPN